MPTQTKHLFISRRGDMLPRWTEAFPEARALRMDAKTSAVRGQAIAWIRLTDNAVADTLAAVRRRLGPDIACVVLADLPDDEQAMTSFGAAAKGYCNTHAAPELLRRIAEVVAQGGLWIGETLMQRLLRASLHFPAATAKPAATPWDAGLTQREREVATAVAAGASNKEIARSLGITERTVKAHVGAILEKLDVRDRLQLSLVVHGQRPR
ncbi:MAG: response regulator transcription factor [Pseudomonas fluorescens]